MRFSIITFVLVLLQTNAAAQIPVHPWWVVDRGGGKSNGGNLVLHSSIGQTTAGGLSAPSNTLEAGYLPGVRWLTGVSSTISINSDNGWNLISLPMLVQDYRKMTLFPSAISFAYGFTATGYQTRDTLQNGAGYWLKFGSAQNIEFTGTTITSDTIDVIAGWNIIGPFSYPSRLSDVSPIPPVAILSSFYGYSGTTGYAVEDTLEPGKAYWMKVSQAGKLVIGSGSVLAGSSAEPIAVNKKTMRGTESLLKDGVHNITFKDAAGRERKLFYTTSRTDMKSTDFELPPPAPEGIIDVRFASQSQFVPAIAGELKGFQITVASVVFPLEIIWTGPSAEGEAYIKIVTDSREPRRIELNGQGSISLNMNELQSISLELEAAATDEIPTSFALAQNYPNPFNPSTVIQYDLPVSAQVSLRVFDLLGREVLSLINEEKPVGRQEIAFDASFLASGAYFYRLEAISLTDHNSSFVQVRKMLLMK